MSTANSENQNLPEVTASQDGEVNLQFEAGATEVTLHYKQASKFGTKLKAKAFEAEMTQSNCKGNLRFFAFSIALPIALVAHVYSIYYFGWEAPASEYALPVQTSVTIFFIFVALISVLLEHHRPRASRAIILIALFATAAEQVWSQHRHAVEQRELADRLHKLQYCKGEDYILAIEQNELPDCTPQWMKDHALKIVKSTD
jgi:hypothetical protein